MSTSVTILGSGLLALLLAGYVAQKYLPAPPPKILGIDLGTTFSSVGIYHAVTGEAEIIPDSQGRKTIPSVVAFLENGTVLIGYSALEQEEKNPTRTIYDAKRFIGKRFESKESFLRETKRYPFQIELDKDGFAHFLVPLKNDKGEKIMRLIKPEEIGGLVLGELRRMVKAELDRAPDKAVISVPAEFDQLQRNATKLAADLAGLEVLRIISEPTAAALSYGLHKKAGVDYVVVVDLGGGTLDVSLLWIQGGLFVTLAMAGNNRLGGQDFNERLLNRLLEVAKTEYGIELTDKEDIQALRLAVETAKLRLTASYKTEIALKLQAIDSFRYEMSRAELENLNADLLEAVLEPIRATLEDSELGPDDVDEIVLVGGSTRIPKVRKIVGEYFKKAPNFGVDPELAVVTGVAVQAGVLGGAWPLQVSATELPADLKKIHVYHQEDT